MMPRFRVTTDTSWVHSDDSFDCARHTCRPAVVIDPENREQVERLAKALPAEWNLDMDAELWRESTQGVQAALRSLVAPPKPEEPTDPAVRVIDVTGVEWAKNTRGHWFASDGPLGTLSWERLTERGIAEVLG